jgi:hypothetical protein
VSAERPHRDNSGVLYRHKKKSDKAPDWSGEVTVDGKRFYISLWEKSGLFRTVAFRPADEAKPQPNKSTDCPECGADAEPETDEVPS